MHVLGYCRYCRESVWSKLIHGYKTWIWLTRDGEVIGIAHRSCYEKRPKGKKGIVRRRGVRRKRIVRTRTGIEVGPPWLKVKKEREVEEQM